MRRLNIGCGTIQPEGWDNADIGDHGQQWWIDILDHPFATNRTGDEDKIDRLGRKPEYDWVGEFDYIVANHLLSCFSHHELKDRVLPRLMRMLKPNGVLRVLVPDADLAIRAYCNNDVAWFPLGPDLPGIDERLCTFLPWFGESKSIFTYDYLSRLVGGLGYGHMRCQFGQRGWSHIDPEIASLDDREVQSLIVEIKAHHDR